MISPLLSANFSRHFWISSVVCFVQSGTSPIIFSQAWNEASNDFEKFLAAYFAGRNQKNPADKLKWLETSLQYGLKVNDEAVKSAYPALYSNIAKCYEDLKVV